MPRRAAGASRCCRPPALFCCFGEGHAAAVRASGSGSEGSCVPGGPTFVQHLLCMCSGMTGLAEAVGVQALQDYPAAECLAAFASPSPAV